MTRLIDIPPELESRLHEEAAQKGITTSDYVRRRLEEQLWSDNRERQYCVS
jgi:predicted DNA-binding protein